MNNMRQLIDGFNDYIEKSKNVYVIITYNFANDNLREKFVADLTEAEFKLKQERDQSTLLGVLNKDQLSKLKEHITEDYIEKEDCIETDFVDIYSTESELSKESIEKISL